MNAALLAVALALGAAPAPVTVGVYVHDIHNVDLATHSYAADVYLWLRWPAELGDVATSLEVMNGYELWGHTRTQEWEEPRVMPDGSRHQVLRVQGRFATKFNLRDYPLDRHVLVLEFEDAHLGADALVYVPDGEGVRLSPGLDLPGYHVGAPRMRVSTFTHPTTFGLPPDAGVASAFSRVRVEIPMARPSRAYATKLMVPLLCVVLCALMMFLFRPRHVDARVGLGSTALLTVVALQITLNDDLPAVEYLVLMDELYLVACVVVLAALGLVVAATRLHERGEEARAEAWDRRGLAVLVGGALLAMVARIAAAG